MKNQGTDIGPLRRGHRITGMKEFRVRSLLAFICLPLLASYCPADTFTHRQTKQVFHGYVKKHADTTVASVHTQEAGVQQLNLSEWDVTADNLGRANKVIVLPILDEMMLDIETSAFEQAMASAADQGPLLILVTLDTPGGRIDFARRMCAAINKADYCPVIAYIQGGQYGGAISAGAAVALSCQKIYMAGNSVIGGAALITPARVMAATKELKFDDAIDEKQSSVWRAYLASLAEQNGRPALLVRAMVDRRTEVIEVTEDGKSIFIEPVDKKPTHQIVRTWNKSGSLLTLTAEEARKCGIADGIADSQQELLRQLNAADADVVTDRAMEKARREFDRVRKRVDEIRKSLDLKVKQSEHSQPLPKALGILRGAKEDFQTLITLGRKYPDLEIDIEAVEAELNTVNAIYEQMLLESKRQR